MSWEDAIKKSQKGPRISRFINDARRYLDSMEKRYQRHPDKPENLLFRIKQIESLVTTILEEYEELGD
jgi:hypothetical protein